MCTKTSLDGYENICQLNVLGVADTAHDNIAVHQNLCIKKQG